MLYIVIPEFNLKTILNIKYILTNEKFNIVLYSNLNNILNKNNKYIFFISFLNPIINFLEELKLIVDNDSIDFCYLSTCKNIFYVKNNNITFSNNNIQIKKTNTKKILFEHKTNIYDHIIPPDDITEEYISLIQLFNISYDIIINFNVSYKTYEKFLKYNVKDDYCYNVILFIDNINQLKFTNLNYKFIRITIFHTIKNYDELLILNNFCYKNKILSRYYLNHNFNNFFNINNKRSIWFEKIILLNNIQDLNDDLIIKLNKYHKNYENIVLDNILSISSTHFVCMPLFENKNVQIEMSNIYNIIKNYMLDNITNIYTNHKDNQYKLKFKELTNYKEKQLLLVRNYNLIIDDIDSQINNNYDINKLSNLLLKKISIGSLCKSEDQILKYIEIITKSIDNIEFLTSLVILLSNFKNNDIMEKLYIKFIKLSIEKSSKISHITLKCFNCLVMSNINEESITTIIEFINYINKNDLFIESKLTKDIIKKILITMFLSISKFIENTNIIESFNKLMNEFFDINDITNIDKLLIIEKNTTENHKICLLHFIIFITTNFSPFYSSYDEFINKRSEIKKNLEYLLTKDIPTCSLNEIIGLPVSNFYLSYQGLPSVDIFKLKSQLLRKVCPDLNYKIKTNFKNKKINICFHSNFLNRWHSVFKDRHQIIKALSLSNDYNVYFSTFDKLNDEVKYLFGNATYIELGKSSLEEIKNKFEKLNLDVLVYCEISMDPRAYFLAHMKLAKIQINTWGHSDTSGIDSIDYFFSSKLYELPYKKSQDHYSEKLVLLNSLCTSYLNPLSKYNILNFKNRYSFGFTDEVVIYFCAQSLFKFNPLYDDYLIEILNNNSNFVLLILDDNSKNKVIKRFNNKNISSRIHVFSGMEHNKYLNLINISDIILDPYPFGGCNSSLEAFALNKVIVTQSGKLINGRFTSGFYKKMGLSEIITNNKKEYINLAIKFGNNIKYRKSIEEKIKNNNHLLFNDIESINEWDSKIKELLQIKNKL